MKIKKGDTVIVLSGKDKGKEGKVLEAFPSRDLVIVDKINMRKRHQKPRRSGGKGQIVEFAAPIHVSNVALKDPKTGKPTRVGFRIEKGKKVRVAKKSGSIIS